MPHRNQPYRALAATLLLALSAVGLGAVPAQAAASTCDRTFIAGEETVAEINAELSSLTTAATTPTYCFTGTFALDAPLDLLGSVTLRAEGVADFVVSGASAMTTANTEQSVVLTVEGLTIRAAEGRPTGDSLIDGQADDPLLSTDIILRNVSISGGAAEFGGAVLGTTIAIFDSVLEDSTATLGGAAHALSILVVIDSEFVGNAAVDGGALSTTGSLTLSSSTFEGNTATTFGGAVHATGIADIENSTFVGNTAGDEGGALFLSGGRVRFSTFLGNAAPAPVAGEEIPGDAIYLLASGVADLQLGGNLLAGSSGHPQLGVGGAAQRVFADLGGNLFSTAAADERDLPTPAVSTAFEVTVDELFGATPGLADNGGPTRTVALAPGATAIDAAGTQDQVRGPDVDQRGLPRGESRDAGAFELQPGEGPEPPTGGGETPDPGVPQPELAESGAADLAASALVGALALAFGAVLIRFRTERRVP